MRGGRLTCMVALSLVGVGAAASTASGVVTVVVHVKNPKTGVLVTTLGNFPIGPPNGAVAVPILVTDKSPALEGEDYDY